MNADSSNPYQPTSEWTTALTPQQLGYLNTLKRFRNHRSALRLFFSEWRVHLVTVATTLFVASPLLFVAMPMTYATFVMGFSVAFFLSSLANTWTRCLVTCRLWPATEEIVDWDVLDRLLAEYGPEPRIESSAATR